MEVLITSKTHKGKAACVGGMIIENNKFVRLLNPGNWDQYADTEFNIGEIWEVGFIYRPDSIPPHIEDIIVTSKHYVRKIENMFNFITNCGVTIYRGSPQNIFDNLLSWTNNGSGYISDKRFLPQKSVGFWISDKDLKYHDSHYTYKIENLFSSPKKLKYVGFLPQIDIIPAGTLMRISLARWWKPEGADMEERCYLQLSGWY